MQYPESFGAKKMQLFLKIYDENLTAAYQKMVEPAGHVWTPSGVWRRSHGPSTWETDRHMD